MVRQACLLAGREIDPKKSRELPLQLCRKAWDLGQPPPHFEDSISLRILYNTRPKGTCSPVCPERSALPQQLRHGSSPLPALSRSFCSSVFTITGGTKAFLAFLRPTHEHLHVKGQGYMTACSALERSEHQVIRLLSDPRWTS